VALCPKAQLAVSKAHPMPRSLLHRVPLAESEQKRRVPELAGAKQRPQARISILVIPNRAEGPGEEPASDSASVERTLLPAAFDLVLDFDLKEHDSQHHRGRAVLQRRVKPQVEQRLSAAKKIRGWNGFAWSKTGKGTTSSRAISCAKRRNRASAPEAANDADHSHRSQLPVIPNRDPGPVRNLLSTLSCGADTHVRCIGC